MLLALRPFLRCGSMWRPTGSMTASASSLRCLVAALYETNMPPRGFGNKQHYSKSSSTEEGHDIDSQISTNLEKIRAGNFEVIKNPEELKHFRLSQSETETTEFKDEDRPHPPSHHIPTVIEHPLPHPIWSQEKLNDVQITHKKPERFVDWLSYGTVKIMRTFYDVLSGYNRRQRDEAVWINRVCFLETVAGVPGMVAAMVRHLHSLRRMRRDHGWIHTLLEEAENERMHLMTALHLKKPGVMFRSGVMITQGVFVTFFSFAYLISPRYCHRLVGYLEEEAVVTYTKLLKDIEDGHMKHWKTKPAPYFAIDYWKLMPNATMRDVILAIRADEAHHRVVNHTLGSMKPTDYNPYKPGE